MDIPILAWALIGFGFYCHYLLITIERLKANSEGMSDMISAMAKELKELGSPNVFIIDKDDEKKETPF